MKEVGALTIATSASVSTTWWPTVWSSFLELVAVVLTGSRRPGPSSLGLEHISTGLSTRKNQAHDSDGDRPAFEHGAVQLLDTSSGIISGVVLDETETPGLLCEERQSRFSMA